jgi:two-component system sensor histidine kinase DegS
MRVDLRPDIEDQKNRFGRLGILYISALAAIALVAVAGQVLIQIHLKRQLTDSEVVNIAGRQRMLSQRMTKSVLLLTAGNDDAGTLVELRESAISFRRAQEGLKSGSDSLGLPGTNSQEIHRLLAMIEPHYQAMLESVEGILALHSTGDVPDSAWVSMKQAMLDHESGFLEGMDQVVGQYALEAHDRVSTLSVMEYVLVMVSLTVILLEIFFVFRPTTQQVSQAIDKLTDSEKNAQKLSKEIGTLYASLEKSYQQIAAVNEPAGNPRLLAKADRGGNVTFVSDQFRLMSHQPDTRGLARFCDLFPSMKDPDEWMDELIERVSEGNSWQGELSFKDAQAQERWVDVIVTPVYGEREEIEELVMAGAEVTHHKIAEKSMLKRNRAEIEKTINQQKFRSVLILEGQEEERKRIAMDIHDGIGQMLTSLKYQIESIDLQNEARSRQKIEEIQHLIQDVIKEVRRVTFNLKPTVLGDYGLQAGLKVFITEIGKVIDMKLVLDASGQTDRLPQKIENNIFRIIQEAINNAIKYSGAERIDVTYRQSEEEVVATVRDEGKGFDTRLLDGRSTNISSGRGFFNMYERTEYVNGKLEINSAPGNGTTVMLTVPLQTTTT